jgi:acetamidase/formamidase
MADGLGYRELLAEAMQQLTTELVRWLERDYKLNPTEAAIVVGTSVRYDIAEIVDPQMHIVAKISKEVLATLSKE